MVRFLVLVTIAITLAYADTKLLWGFLIALVYCIACNVVDDKKEGGDC